MRKTIKSILNKFYLYRYLAYRKHKWDVENNLKGEANRVYYPFFKQEINWENPKNLIEKIFWLQFNTDTSLWTKYADKYLARDYIKECGFEHNLPKLYGKWSNADDIDFNELPESFVLKTNNGCGTVLVVKDKSKLNIKSTKRKFNQWLSIPYGYSGAQLHYTKIEPCIIAEEMLERTDNYSSSLVDYKIWCFHGKAECILITFNRSSINLDLSLYDTDWNKINQHLVSGPHYSKSHINISRPESLNKMIEIAEKLSKTFRQVRVDFYNIKGKPYIGELTFTTGWGYFTHDYYDYLGSKIDLNKVNS